MKTPIPNEYLRYFTAFKINLICILFALGVVIHEFCHVIVAKFFKIKIQQVIYWVPPSTFDINKLSPFRGCVTFDPKCVKTMTSWVAFCISAAPFLTILPLYCLGIYFYPRIEPSSILSIMGVVVASTIIFCSFPSQGDWITFDTHLRKNGTKHLASMIAWWFLRICSWMAIIIDIFMKWLIEIVMLSMTIYMSTNLEPVECFTLSNILLVIIKQSMEVIKLTDGLSNSLTIRTNVSFCQTFPRCKICYLCRWLFKSFFPSDQLVPSLLNLGVDIKKTKINEFLVLFPFALEIKNANYEGVQYTVELPFNEKLKFARYGLFSFGKSGILEGILINFSEDLNLSALKWIKQRLFEIENKHFFYRDKKYKAGNIPILPVTPLNVRLAGNILRINPYLQSGYTQLIYSTFYFEYFQKCKEKIPPLNILL